jgi:hypothetical protein
MSGRGLGYCAGYDRPGFQNETGPRRHANRFFNGDGDGGAGFGRGYGFGRRAGYGNRRGFGLRQGFNEAFDNYGVRPAVNYDNKKEEPGQNDQTALQSRISALETGLQALNRQLDALQKK